MRQEFGRVGIVQVALFGLLTLATSEVDAGLLFGRDTRVITTQSPAQFVMVPMATQPIAIAAGVPGPTQFFAAVSPVAVGDAGIYTAVSFAVEPRSLAQAQAIHLSAKFATLRARLAQDVTKLGGLITYLNQAKAGGTTHQGALLKMGIEFVAKYALGGVVPTDIIMDLVDLIDEFIFGKPAITPTNNSTVLVPGSNPPGGSGPPTISGMFEGKLGDQPVRGQITGTLNLTPTPTPTSPPPAGNSQTLPIQEISDSILGLQTQVQSLHRKVDRIGK